MRCPTCYREGYDHDEAMALMMELHDARIARQEAFEHTYRTRQIRCPQCRKRVSAKWDRLGSLDADTPTVTMKCHHCGHDFDIPREVHDGEADHA